MANSAIVIACLSSVSPEEHSLVIRDVPPYNPYQFRVYCAGYRFNIIFNLVICI